MDITAVIILTFFISACENVKEPSQANSGSGFSLIGSINGDDFSPNESYILASDDDAKSAVISFYENQEIHAYGCDPEVGLTSNAVSDGSSRGIDIELLYDSEIALEVLLKGKSAPAAISFSQFNKDGAGTSGIIEAVPTEYELVIAQKEDGLLHAAINIMIADKENDVNFYGSLKTVYCEKSH